MNKTKTQIKKIISEVMEIDIKKIKKSTHLFKDLDVDSLDIIEIAMSIEKKFQIEIPDKDLEKLDTVNIIINYIEKNKLKNMKNIKK